MSCNIEVTTVNRLFVQHGSMNRDDAEDPHIQRRKDPSGQKTAAWEQTLEDMDTIASERKEEGYDVLTLMAAHTDTVSIDMGDHDDYGLFHIVPNNQATDFEDVYESDAFTEYFAYGTDVQGYMYLVTEMRDAENQRVILLASQYDMTRADSMVQSAEQEGILPQHVKTIDGTTLAIIEHSDFESLVSRPSS